MRWLKIKNSLNSWLQPGDASPDCLLCPESLLEDAFVLQSCRFLASVGGSSRARHLEKKVTKGSCVKTSAFL